MRKLKNIWWLGLKEIRSLVSDKVLMLSLLYAFTYAVYAQATGTSSEVNNASIAIADEDGSPLSKELDGAFFPPRFQRPIRIAPSEVEEAMDRGRFMFVVTIPPRFESDLLAGRHPEVQLSLDATALTQAGIGSGYISAILSERIKEFLGRAEASQALPINLVVHRLFNPNGVSSWFVSVIAIINQLTLLTVVLTGTAVIREREHGTLEHLLVMPLSSTEIALAKVWANALVIVLATAMSLFLVVRTVLHVSFVGSVPLWFAGVIIYLFFATALGIFLGTVSRSMAQFGLLIILVVLIMQLLSGGGTPIESQPRWMQKITWFLPTRHFVSFSQVIIYRGGGLAAVWRDYVLVGAVGFAFFLYSVGRFRKSIAAAK